MAEVEIEVEPESVGEVGEEIFRRGADTDDTWDDTALVNAYDNAVSELKTEMGIASEAPDGVQKNKKRKKNKPRKKKNAAGAGDGFFYDQSGSIAQGNSKRWRMGELCSAVYSEDGCSYDALIVAVDEGEGTCTVRYVGYGNEEQQAMTELMLPESSELNTSLDDVGGASGTSLPTSAASSRGGRGRSRGTRPIHPLMGPPPHPGYPHMMGPPHMPGFQPPMPGMSGWPPMSGPNPPGVPMLPLVPPPPPMFDSGLGSDKEALHSMLISWYMSGYHTGYYQGLREAKSAGGVELSAAGPAAPLNRKARAKRKQRAAAEAPVEVSADVTTPAAAAPTEEAAQGLVNGDNF